MNKRLPGILGGVIVLVFSGCTAVSSPVPTATPTALPATATPAPAQETSPESNPTAIDGDSILSPETIKDYLTEQIGVSSFGGKVFSAYQVMGTEPAGEFTKIYLWVLVQEYYVDQQTLQMGTGTSEPVVLFVQMQDGEYQIVDYKDAGEGYQHLTENFPPNILPLIQLPADAYNQRSDQLSDKVEKEAKAYFSLP